MFRFYEPKYAVLLFISVILLLHLMREFYKYRKTILGIFSEDVLYKVTKNYDMGRIFRMLLALGIVLMVISIAIMGPQFGRRTVDVKKKGVDLIIALDVSKSMLAQDILPSRLERAKLELGNLISMLKGDRVGVILFAGQAFMQVPLTTDYDAARLFLRNVGVDSVPVQGTNFRSALSLANEMFGNLPQSSGAKVVLILSDGEDHQGNYDEIVGSLVSSGIRVYAIGLGTLTGEPVPENIEGSRSYKKDKTGQVVVSRLNEGILKKITASTGGIYIQGGSKELGIPLIMDEIRSLKKGEIVTKDVYDYLDRYWILSIFATILLIYAFYITPFLKTRRQNNDVVSIMLLLVFLFGFSPFLRENPETKEGNNLYQEGKFQDAIKMYESAQKRLEREPLLHYNKGIAYMKEKRYNEAYNELKRGLTGADDRLKSKIYYNMGNLFLEQQKYDEAIDSYIKSIQFNREAIEPKHNLEMVLRMQKREGEKEKGDQNRDKKEENKEDGEKKEQSKKEEEKDGQMPQNRDGRMDLAKAEQLLDSLKEKETEQPFSKFLIKDFNIQNVEKDW